MNTILLYCPYPKYNVVPDLIVAEWGEMHANRAAIAQRDSQKG